MYEVLKIQFKNIYTIKFFLKGRGRNVDSQALLQNFYIVARILEGCLDTESQSTELEFLGRKG